MVSNLPWCGKVRKKACLWPLYEVDWEEEALVGEPLDKRVQLLLKQLQIDPLDCVQSVDVDISLHLAPEIQAGVSVLLEPLHCPPLQLVVVGLASRQRSELGRSSQSPRPEPGENLGQLGRTHLWWSRNAYTFGYRKELCADTDSCRSPYSYVNNRLSLARQLLRQGLRQITCQLTSYMNVDDLTRMSCANLETWNGTNKMLGWCKMPRAKRSGTCSEIGKLSGRVTKPTTSSIERLHFIRTC